MKKSFILIIIIILAILAVSAFFVWEKAGDKGENVQQEVSQNNQQEQNSQQQAQEQDKEDEQEKDDSWQAEEFDTSNWKIYKNENWGYSIKYPADFFIDNTPYGDAYPGDDCPLVCGNGGRSLIISDIEEMGHIDVMPDEKVHVVVSTQKKKEGQTLEDYVVRDVNWIRYEDLMVDSRKGLLRIADSKKFIGLTIEEGEWFYDIYGENLSKDYISSNYSLIERIIKSFNFL